MEKHPLLSICIPTYNRASILEKALQNITENKAFDNDVEIVISDNCSTDNTAEIVRKYMDKYSNIFYYKNEKNVQDENFWIVLNEAHGEYLKLHNDYLGFSEDGLSIMKDYLRKYHNMQIFFTSGCIYTKKNISTCLCNNLDDYQRCISTFATYIAIFGLWKKDLHCIQNPLEHRVSKLPQLDWTYKLLSKVGKSMIVNEETFITLVDLGPKGGYNWFDIHMKNYYELMLPYVHNNYISKKTYSKDVSNCLWHFRLELICIYIYTPSFYKFDKKGTLRILFHYGKKSPFLYMYIMIFPWLLLLKPFMHLFYKTKWIHDFAMKILDRKIIK